MREIRLSGSEGGGNGTTRSSLPLCWLGDADHRFRRGDVYLTFILVGGPPAHGHSGCGRTGSGERTAGQ